MEPLKLTLSIQDNWDALVTRPARYMILDFILQKCASEVEEYKWLAAGPYCWTLDRIGGDYVLEIAHMREDTPEAARLTLTPF